MPSPPTPKRAGLVYEKSPSPSKPKPVDLGKALGAHDTSLVRDRVRQWQAQGGGVVIAPDICVVEEEEGEDSSKRKTPKQSGSRKPSRRKATVRHEESPKTPTKREGRQTSQSAKKEDHDSRSGSAPPKRVVSDAHWRTERSPPRSAASSKATRDGTPRKVLPDDGIRVRPMAQPKQRTRRNRESDSNSPPKEDAAVPDDGIRVYSTPPGSQRQSVRQKQRSGSPQISNRSNPDVASSRSTSPLTQESPNNHRTAKSTPRVRSFTAKESSRRQKPAQPRDVPMEEPPRSASGTFAEERTSTKSHKGGILSHVFGESKKIFSKQPPIPIATPRVPSIEAWLNDTPDPFIDGEEPPIEVIPPLRPYSKSRKANPEAEPETNRDSDPEAEPQRVPVLDPNQIWDALGVKDATRRHVTGSRRKRRVRSSAIYEDNPFPDSFDTGSLVNSAANGSSSASKMVDITQDAPKLSSSPSSIQRRGAKRNSSSPTRDRRKTCASKENVVQEDARSAVSTVLSGSSVEGPLPTAPRRPPGITLKRPFPSTGLHRLSTIASVETFSSRAQAATPSISEASEATALPATAEEYDAAAEAKDHFDPQSLERTRSHLTKHADLISVLSLPKAGNQSIISARSIRTNRSRLATATIGDLMNELATDESKYMRELRTLVDGVIPVLLTCVLSKSDSAIAAGLFRPSSLASEDPNFTKPIVDMGIALERLKTLHKRIPQQDPKSFLTWAHGAQRVYAEYTKAWRMGFQDVVVNLAPAAENGTSAAGEANELDGGLPRNADGDVINGDGERVDVAFLLKRPLVRLKYLAKTLKGINFVQASPEAADLSIKYQNLVIDARNRSNEERARLEDEAAAAIDPTRARDPRTLAPLTGVSIDKTGHVRARDHFNLALQHSSGQLVDCRVELLLRDEATGQSSGGDLLICEVDGTGKRLLFPPIQSGRVSARNGDKKGEIVAMIRGVSTNSTEWHELLSLRSDDEQAGFEWVQMLGLIPVPPRVMRTQSFLRKHQRHKSGEPAAAARLEPAAIPTSPVKSRTPSPREIEVPIGEQANGTSKTWLDNFLHGPTASPREGSKLQKPTRTSPPATPSKLPQTYVDEVNDLRSLPSQRRPQTPEPARTPRSLNEALGLSGTSSMSGLKRTKAKRTSKHGSDSPRSPLSEDDPAKEIGVRSPLTDPKSALEREVKPEDDSSDPRSSSPVYDPSRSSPRPRNEKGEASRPSPSRSRSSVPSMDLPTIPKIRKDSPPSTPIQELEAEPEWPRPAEIESPHTPSNLTKKRPSPLKSKQEDVPPPTPAHRSPSPVQLNGSKTPTFTPRKTRPRRSSSPLKHEYAPSTSSDNSSDSETSTVAHNEQSSVSDSSDDEELEHEDVPAPMLPLGAIHSFPKPTPPSSIYSLPNGTLAPSNSASQAPYKMVPSQPTKATKTIASIFFWAENGSWQSIHPDECSILITPGLIEAYEMSAAHSTTKPISALFPIVDVDAFSEVQSTILSDQEETQSQRPLIGLEVTPLVPIRRGTALDISIRSPPTPNSLLKPGIHIMFRSRNPEECEALYALINHSRINNPTFIALQNARPPTTTASSMDRRTSSQAGSRNSSWFGLGRSPSYRASSGRTPSIAPSESSISSMSSAFSALKRFSSMGQGGGMFNISRSTIGSRIGSRANSVYTSSDNSSGTGTSGSGANSPLPPGMNAGADRMGLSNAKIRLYIRETASRWRDLGSARLTIMQPTPPQALTTLHPETGGGVPMNRHLKEKRVVVNGKTKGEVLLDVQLGETCFERVARTGIAVSVWEDVVGPNGELGVVNAVGGVGAGRARVYMIQVCFFLPSHWGALGELVLGQGADVCADEERSRDGVYFLHCRKTALLIQVNLPVQMAIWAARWSGVLLGLLYI